jgi:Cu/Zn superoxide dismutase
MGTVTFTNLGPSVEISIAITSCQHGKSYPIHIHTGTSCADEMSQGGHWDPPRGEGIPAIDCVNAIGMVLTQRDATDAKPWTVGPPAESNVIGHVMVLHDPDDPTKRIACGELKAQK